MTAVEIVGGRAVNPGAGPAALTPNTGGTFTVRNTQLGSKIHLDQMWYSGAAAGFVRVRSPRLHDNVQGIKYQVQGGRTANLMGYRPRTKLVPQDVLTVEIGGGAAETDDAFIGIYYESLPGSDGRWATWEALEPRIVDIVTVEVNIAAAATLGDWSAGTALNATNDLLKANTDYAWFGYTSALPVGAIALQGPDVGGLKVGGPGANNLLDNREYFINLDKAVPDPYIPIFNSANKGGTLAFQADSSAGAANLTDFVFAELTPA